MSLYAAVLGPKFERLPMSLRQLHDRALHRPHAGECQVTRGRGFLAWLIGACMGFPPAGEQVPIRFTIQWLDGAEHWQRDFGGHALVSVFRLEGAQLMERMGPADLQQTLVQIPDGVQLCLQSVRVFGLTLRPIFCPQVRAVAYDQGGRYVFEVSASMPWVGEVIRYQGYLLPAG